MKKNDTPQHHITYYGEGGKLYATAWFQVEDKDGNPVTFMEQKIEIKKEFVDSVFNQ